MKKIFQIVPVIVVSVIAGFVLGRFVDLSDTEAPVPAIADKGYLNGSELLTACKNQLEIYDREGSRLEFYDKPYNTRCFSSLALALDPMSAKLAGYCPPDKLKIPQAARIVVKFLEKNPQRLHEPEGYLVASALHQAFPCK